MSETTDQTPAPPQPDWRVIAEQLARALKLHGGCTCVYERKGGIPTWDKGQRKLERQCSRCAALVAYQMAVEKSDAA